MNDITVSIIIPVLNESRYISSLISSLSKQTYPKNLSEFVFVDGGSEDDTKELIEINCRKYGLSFYVFDNPNRITPYALNIGMEKSHGDVIALLSAHSEYNDDYILNGVKHLLESDADNVGGYLITVGNGFIGGCISKVLSSWFGVGGSSFRIDNKTQYVDTVPFGIFRRELINKIGGFNTNLPRSEDNEFNYRIRKNGGKILMVSDMVITYYCRNNINELVAMGFSNGKGVGYTAVNYPGVMKFKHFVPCLFVVSLITLFALSIIFRSVFIKGFLLLELCSYLLLDLFFSIKSKQSFLGVAVSFLLFPIFHVSYGLGTIAGLISCLKREKNKQNSTKK